MVGYQEIDFIVIDKFRRFFLHAPYNILPLFAGFLFLKRPFSRVTLRTVLLEEQLLLLLPLLMEIDKLCNLIIGYFSPGPLDHGSYGRVYQTDIPGDAQGRFQIVTLCANPPNKLFIFFSFLLWKLIRRSTW